MDDLATLEPDRLDQHHDPMRPERVGRIEREHRDGVIHVVKRSHPAARAELRREAEVLRAVGGSTVVHLVEVRDLPDTTELVLDETGGPSLAAVLSDPATPVGDALAHLANACELVARLHSAGWAHGRVSADHVLMTPRGRMRLCSLAAAQTVDVDPLLARRDRSALLRMVDDWVAAASGRRSPLHPSSGLVLTRVARRTRRLPDDPDPIVLARILRRCTSLRGPKALAVLVAAAMIGLGLVGAVGRSRGQGTHASAGVNASTERSPTWTILPVTSLHQAPEPTTATPPAPETTAPETTAPETTAPPGCAASPEPVAATVDVDGDGCADRVLIDGNTVSVGALRYRIGTSGDVVAVGDWDCDGRSTPAVLDPRTGAVHTFDDWATGSEPSTAAFAGTAADAMSITAPETGCGPPVATRTDGTTIPVGAP